MMFANGSEEGRGLARVDAKFDEAERLMRLSPKGREAYGRLSLLRAKLAREARVPAYRILSNAQLLELSELRPQDTTQLAAMTGIGTLLVRAYGDEIVAALRVELAKITG